MMRASFLKIISISAVASVFMFATPVSADVINQCNDPAISSSIVCSADDGGALFGPNSIWNNLLNVLTYVVGAIAVLMVIIGGIRYALSQGDQSSTTAAKNTILYALIALIIAVMANALVNFVLSTI
jgi:hypothetical protein